MASIDLNSYPDVTDSTVTFRIYFYNATGDYYFSDTGPYPSVDSTPSSYTAYDRSFSIWGDGPCEPVTSTDVHVSCGSDTLVWIDGNTYTSSNNTASYTMYNAASNGCDSIVYLDYTIVSNINVNVSYVDSALKSEASGSNISYQWIDCINNYYPVLNETGQFFTTQELGYYAVVVDNLGCKDTSECLQLSPVGIEELDWTNKISVYPNPSTGAFTVSFDPSLLASNNQIQVEVYDVHGQLMESGSSNSNTGTVRFEAIEETGIYLVKLTDRHGRYALLKVLN